MTATHLKQIRESRGLAAAELARLTGVARQTIYAIENGSFVPNTIVALQLARALDVTVELLFELDPETPAAPECLEAELVDQQTETYEGQGVRLARVGRKIIAAPSSMTLPSLPASDGVVCARRARGSITARVPGGAAELEDEVIIAGCDPAISLLSRFLAGAKGPGVIAVQCSSLRALNLLKNGRVHMAGMHLRDRVSGEFNLPFIRRIFPRGGFRVVTYAAWEQGFVVAPENPLNIRSAADLSRPDVRLMNREEGAGSRELLDYLLQQAGVNGASVRGYGQVAFGHVAAAEAVRAGRADCCIANRATARALGLDFLPLATERYDLVTRERFASESPATEVFEALNRLKLRAKLEQLAGYDTSQTGSIRG